MPEHSNNIFHWAVIAFGGVSAVAVIVLATYWLVMELVRRPGESGKAVAARDQTADAPEHRTDQE